MADGDDVSLRAVSDYEGKSQRTYIVDSQLVQIQIHTYSCMPKRLNNGVLSSMQKQTQKRLKSGFKINS